MPFSGTAKPLEKITILVDSCLETDNNSTVNDKQNGPVMTKRKQSVQPDTSKNAGSSPVSKQGNSMTTLLEHNMAGPRKDPDRLAYVRNTYGNPLDWVELQ